jgi:hypothetical protein
MDPTRVSPSSPVQVATVNGEGRPRAFHRFLRLRRRIIRIERSFKGWTPRPYSPPVPTKPPAADQVLDALAEAFEPGSQVSTAQIVAVAGVSAGVVNHVRSWAKAVGEWPYRPGALRHAGWAELDGLNEGGGDV